MSKMHKNHSIFCWYFGTIAILHFWDYSTIIMIVDRFPSSFYLQPLYINYLYSPHVGCRFPPATYLFLSHFSQSLNSFTKNITTKTDIITGARNESTDNTTLIIKIMINTKITVPNQPGIRNVLTLFPVPYSFS